MMGGKLFFVILKNELDADHLLWVEACKANADKIDYSIVDLSCFDWLEKIQQKRPAALLAKPGGVSASFKQLYDERIYILEKVLGYFVYPAADEVFIYENKRFLASWLAANRIPHPRTWVSYHQKEALELINTCNFPLVAKTNIGASGSGVTILKQRQEGLRYVEDVFSGKGAAQRTGPNLKKGRLLQRGIKYLFNPSKIAGKLHVYKLRYDSIQKGFVIFQQYIPHDYEWRVVRIGHSFFAHKKLVKDEKASGSLLKGYDNPPLALFDFVKGITDKHQFYSQAVDVFEGPDGYLVNEMQCIFGQSDPYQMLVDGVPGRYVFKHNQWMFEAGDFNRHESFNLRIEYLIETLT